MQQNDNLLNILGILYKWRKQIIYTCVAAAIISVACSLMLSNYYKSSTIFYAASPDLAKPSPVGPSDMDQDFYGEEEDLDRLFSISSSGAVVDYIITKYDLYNHYDINPDSQKGPYNIRRKFNKMYTSLKTKFGALQLSFEDKDPKLAAAVANDARNKISEITQQLIKESQAKLLTTYTENIKYKEDQYKNLNDSLYAMRKRFDIYNTESQGQVYAEIMAKVDASLNDKNARLEIYRKSSGTRDSVKYLSAAVAGLKSQKKQLEDQVNWFNKGLAQVMGLEFEQKDFAKQLNLDKERLKQLQAAYNNPFNAIHVVESAEVPLVKSKPMRSIIVMASVFAAFILSCLAALLLHSYKNLNWSRIKNHA